MDDEAKPYLLTEASGLTGLSVDALRKRIERKKLRGTRSNEDGQWRVWLTSKDVETAKFGQVLDKSGQVSDGPPDESRTIKALEGEAAALRDALVRERERVDRAEAGRDAALAGEAKAREELAALAVRVAVAETETKALRERAEKTEARADRAEEEARRPFWRRWLGVAALCAASASGLWPAVASAQTDTASATWVMPGCRASVSETGETWYRQGVCAGVVRAISAMDVDMCVPGAVTQGQKLRVLVHYIDARPERQHENFVKLAVEALRAAWPCR